MSWWEESAELARALEAPTPYPFQDAAVDELRARIREGYRRPLLVSPTGSGKTLCASMVIKASAARGKSVLFLAHSRELIRQASNKLWSFGVPHGVIMAGRPRTRSGVQVASKGTLYSRAIKRGTMNLPPADLIVVDEAHGALARTWQAIIEKYPRSFVLGLTATPCRGDGKSLHGPFDVMVQAAQSSELIRDGHLVPTVVYAPYTPRLRGVKVTGGDYQKAQLEARMDRPKLVGDVVKHWLDLAGDRLTIVFASGRSHSKHLRDRFRAAGVPAEHIDSKDTPREERDEILRAFARGEFRVLCNVDICSVGYDNPEAACVVLARPTRSFVRYKQCCGRVQRPCKESGKVDALLLDHAGSVHRFGLPDADVEWRLEEGDNVQRRLLAKRKDPRTPREITCPECYFVFSGKSVCPQCGWNVPATRGKPVEYKQGQLVRVDDAPVVSDPDARVDREAYWRRCLGVMASKGRTFASAAMMYKTRFGRFPEDWLPDRPDKHGWRMSVALALPHYLPGYRQTRRRLEG